MSAQVFDDRVCQLGEGPLWHPLRNQLFWFDILNQRLMTRVEDKEQSWSFGEMVSAAAWVDADTLLIASETALLRFDIETGLHSPVCALDADNPVTRSNDGRADPFGGFGLFAHGANPEPTKWICPTVK